MVGSGGWDELCGSEEAVEAGRVDAQLHVDQEGLQPPACRTGKRFSLG